MFIYISYKIFYSFIGVALNRQSSKYNTLQSFDNQLG